MKNHAIRFEASPSLRMWGHAALQRRRAMSRVILLVTLTLAGWVTVESWHALGRLRALNNTESALQAQIARTAAQSAREVAGTTDSASALPPDSRKGINRVIRRLNTPWPQVFATIERLTPPHVAILRLEPDGHGVLTIEAESTSIDHVIAYAGDLAHQGVFGDVSYRRHSTNDQDPNRPVRLTFQLALKDGS